jgi:hypothetical protein
MTTKHTPAPWHVGGDGTIIYDTQGWAVANASVFHGRHEPRTEAIANANLIASAPDLLAALEDAITAHDKGYDTPWGTIRNALNKAKGD